MLFCSRHMTSLIHLHRLHDGGPYAVLVARFENLTIGGGLEPFFLKYLE